MPKAEAKPLYILHPKRRTANTGGTWLRSNTCDRGSWFRYNCLLPCPSWLYAVERDGRELTSLSKHGRAFWISEPVQQSTRTGDGAITLDESERTWLCALFNCFFCSSIALEYRFCTVQGKEDLLITFGYSIVKRQSRIESLLGELSHLLCKEFSEGNVCIWVSRRLAARRAAACHRRRMRSQHLSVYLYK